jgi:HSP20 family protein
MSEKEATVEKARAVIQPACSICEDDGKVSLHIEMPGVEKDGIEVSVEKNELIISGKATKTEAEGTYLIRERHPGDYRKRFIIDDTIDQEKIEASMNNGILSLTLHTKESAKPKKIEIR